jgi:hypothetical protein
LSGLTLGSNLTANLAATITVLDTLTLTNGATVSLLSGYQCCNYYSTYLNFSGNGTTPQTTPLLTGTGTVLLSNNTAGYAGTLSYVQPTVGALTIANGITIHGGYGQVGTAALGLTNNGIINADVAGQPLTVTGTGWTNGTTSVLEATAGTLSLLGSWTNPLGNTIAALTGGTLTLGGTWSNAGIIVENGGTLNLASNFTTAQLGTVNRTAGTVNLSSAWSNSGSYDLAAVGDVGALNLLTGSSITGGTVMSSSMSTIGLTIPVGNTTTLSGLTLGANLTANLGATITVPDTLTLANGATVSLLSGYQCCA